MFPKKDDNVVAQVANVLATAIQQTRAEQQAHVKATWDSLNRNQRGTYANYLYQQGFTQQQIADVTKTSQPTISNYIRKEREKQGK